MPSGSLSFFSATLEQTLAAMTAAEASYLEARVGARRTSTRFEEPARLDARRGAAH